MNCPQAEMAVSEAWQWLDTFDRNYSRFRSDSLIGQLNQTNSLSEPPKELLQLLDIGVQWFQKSHGRLNFLTGHLQEAHGYNAAIDFEEKSLSTIVIPDPTTDLSYNNTHATLRRGMVDLGSFGKGYAIDQIFNLLYQYTQCSFCVVNGGGDLYLHNPMQYSYPLYLSHPWEPETFTHVLEHYHGGIANSNATLRQWQTKNTKRKYSHLLDLTDLTRNPDTLAAATVCAGTALDADAYATMLTLVPAESNTGRLIPYPYLRIFTDGSSRHTSDFPAKSLV